MGRRPARGPHLPDDRPNDGAPPPRLNSGPFAPLAGLHTGHTGDTALDTIVGRFACALAGFIAAMIAAQFCRVWLAGWL